MRQIVLDTETTGLEPELGHRILEIAAVEISNRRTTGRHFHRYVNPGRDSDEAALRVHGITTEFLADKPKFTDIVADLLAFIGDGELVIHNAPFDVGFLDHELKRVDRFPLSHYCPQVLDTLRLARELHPGKRNSLDALCERYQINNSGRSLHGALLDAQLLAEAYLAMTRGQEALIVDLPQTRAQEQAEEAEVGELRLVVVRADAAERAAHLTLLDEIDKESRGACVWKKLEAL